MKIVTKILAPAKGFIPAKCLHQAIISTLIANFVVFNLTTTPAMSQTDDTNSAMQPPAAGPQPALNVVTPPQRQPLAPPPETPSDNLQGAQAIAVQKGAAPVSLPQAWRLKAFSLFKAGTISDKSNNIMAAKIAAPYRSAFEAVRKALTDNNLTIEALSLTAGHILVSSTNTDGSAEKAIIAMRQNASDNGTDIRVCCETKNRTLTIAQLKPLFDNLSSGGADLNNRNGANSL